jgi:phage repressor protein C with HTH and peptisase S24 domain
MNSIRFAIVLALLALPVGGQITKQEAQTLARGARNAVDAQNARHEEQAGLTTGDKSKESKPAEPPKASEEPKPTEEKTASNTPAPEMVRERNRENQRDPFLSPIVRASATGPGCNVGKRCLAVTDIALLGVVRGPNGMIAVVTNAMKKTYFLRESDPLYNGTVLRITGDSMVLREIGTDNVGHPIEREVVKKIIGPA